MCKQLKDKFNHFTRVMLFQMVFGFLVFSWQLNGFFHQNNFNFLRKLSYTEAINNLLSLFKA